MAWIVNKIYGTFCLTGEHERPNEKSRVVPSRREKILKKFKLKEDWLCF